MTARDVVVVILAATVCFVLVGCVVVGFFRPIPVYVATAITQTLSVMVGGVVGYAAGKGSPPE